LIFCQEVKTLKIELKSHHFSCPLYSLSWFLELQLVGNLLPC
jgi:hypothetical protein